MYFHVAEISKQYKNSRRMKYCLHGRGKGGITNAKKKN